MVNERDRLIGAEEESNEYGSIPKAPEIPRVTKSSTLKYFHYPYSEEEKQTERIRQRKIVLGSVTVWLVFLAIGLWPLLF